MDVAALSLSVDSGDVVKAANDLDKFSAAAARAGASAGNQNGSIAKLVATVQSMNAKLGVVVGSLDKISNAMNTLSRASRGAGSAQNDIANDVEKAGRAFASADAHINAYRNHLQSLVADQGRASSAFAAADAHVLAYAEHLRQLSNIPPPPPPPSPSGADPKQATSSSPYYGAAGIEATGQAAQLAAHHAQNLFYQLNDLFVSLASGQKPLTVFIQQGSQIGQIYAQTGLTLKGFTMGLASMLGLLKTTTAATEAAAFANAQQATTSVAAANATATANVRAAETNILIAQTQLGMATTATEAAAAQARLAIAVNALAVSEAEAAITTQALAASQAELAAASQAASAATTASLTAAGAAVIALAGVLVLFVAAVAAMNRQASDDSGLRKFTTAMGYTKAEVAKLNAVSVSWGDTAKAVFQVAWQRIASAMGITTDELGKKWNAVLDWMASATRATVAGIYAAFTGMQNVLPRIVENIKSGKKENLFEVIGGSFKDQYQEAQRFMDDVVKQSRKNARARQDAMATAMYDKPTAPKGGGKAAFGFNDILKDAAKTERDLRAAASAIGLYGEQLARATYEADLFNKAAEHGLRLSPQQTAQIRALAASLAALAETNRHAQFMEDFAQQSVSQVHALEVARGAIGLTGAALAQYTFEQERLNEAVAKHITLTDADREAIRAAAERVGTDAYSNIREKSASDNAMAHAESMRLLDAERGALGLTGEALISYNRQQELINRALAEGVQFKDLDIEKTRRQADAYAHARYGIDQQAQAIADAREVTRGFFADWINGVREGGNAFQAFTGSVLNGLNRIIDKLLDKALNGFIDSIFSGFGGGFGGVKSIMSGANASLASNRTGMATGFAKGGAFTNKVVTSPTLFRFANGAALGEMGEAGPEAIMPLKRGPNGALGVQMHGGGGGARKAEINITQHYSMPGAIMPDAIRALVQQGSQAAVGEAKRQLQTWLQEIDIDGAVVS